MNDLQDVQGTRPESDTLMRVRGLTKTFPGTVALNDVDFSIRSGEVTALLGHNGSGKSTIVKILSGLYKPDSGSEIDVDAEMHFIHQDLGLVADLNAIENLNIRGGGLASFLPFNARRKIREAEEHLALFETHFDVTVPISSLSPAQRSIIAIVRATQGWTHSRNILVLDEPTATFNAREAELLLNVMRKLKESGAGLLFITHHLSEVFQVADHVIVLRDGEIALEGAASTLTEQDLIRAISGDADIGDHPAPRTTEESIQRDARFEIVGVDTVSLDDVSFQVGRGEVIGICGVVGSGREQLLGAIYGQHESQIQQIRLDGDLISGRGPQRLRRHGIGFLPANRLAEGSFPLMNARENLTMLSLKSEPYLSVSHEYDDAVDELARFSVQPPDPERKFQLFSGGNQQKIVLAKWLMTTPKVMMIDEPTQGVDVGVRASIHRIIRAAARQHGTSFVIASSDEDELASLCDAVFIMNRGHIVERLEGPQLTKERLFQSAMAGI